MSGRIVVHAVVTTAAVLTLAIGTAVSARAGQLPGTAGQADRTRISADDLAGLMARNAVTVVDVRDEGMYRRGHLPGARLAPPDQWREVALALQESARPVVTYCSCPAEETSLRAAERFKALGVADVRALLGGYEGWAAAGRPVVQQEPVPGRPPVGGSGSRESWQRVPDIFAALGVAAGAVIADVGAGDGFFTTRLARAVGPAGKIYAVDISPSALDRLQANLRTGQIENVEPVLGTATDPRLPAGRLDAALIVNAYHEMTEHQAMLDAIRRALKPGGRLVIVESVMDVQRGLPRAAQTGRHQLAPHFVQRDVLDAGFYITRFEDAFTRPDSHAPEYLLVVRPLPAPSADVSDVHEHAPGEIDAVVGALQLERGMTVVDLGAGSGSFAHRFARLVGPSGRAIALDVDRAAIAGIARTAAAESLTNCEARVVAEDDPGLAPSTADVIFLRNTYHHLSDRVRYGRKLLSALKTGGRLVIVDFPPDAAMRRTMPSHPDRATVERELAEAGFVLRRSHDFLTGQFFLEFAAR
jgi:ubiquinone/menaquinone biosynthesis C-methylase UbiE/rhodanese-related sulfurtransferase